jgi:hypothetical protein
MNSIHDNGKNDQSLNDDLDRLGHAYGRLEQEEPPELLDQAILNRAHRAVENKPHWMKFSWLHGLTTAAVFVLAFTLILNQRETGPIYDNGIINAESAGLQTDEMPEKQSPGHPADIPLMEMKSEGESRQFAPAGVSVGAAAESVLTEPILEDKAGQSVFAAQRSISVEYNPQDKSERVDRDAATEELMRKEMLSNKLDFNSVDPEVDAVSGQYHPAPVSGPLVRKVKTQSRENAAAEQKILVIIELKRNGNEAWKTALEAFMENYPDYPLPDELTP